MNPLLIFVLVFFGLSILFIGGGILFADMFEVISDKRLMARIHKEQEEARRTVLAFNTPIEIPTEIELE